MQCHVQEITTALAADTNGFYLLGGTKGGRLHAWDIASGNLLLSWQAHFKSITSIKFTPCGNFCITSSADGMVRAWDVNSILCTNGAGGSSRPNSESAKSIISPYRYVLPFPYPYLSSSPPSSFGLTAIVALLQVMDPPLPVCHWHGYPGCWRARRMHSSLDRFH